MTKKLILDLNLACFGPHLVSQIFFLGILPLLDVVNCCKLSLHAILRKANESNLKTWQKIVLGMILAPLKFLVKIWTPNIFL